MFFSVSRNMLLKNCKEGEFLISILNIFYSYIYLFKQCVFKCQLGRVIVEYTFLTSESSFYDSLMSDVTCHPKKLLRLLAIALKY